MRHLRHMLRKSLFIKLKEDPIDLLARAWRNTVVGPASYRTTGGDYDAAFYWRDLFTRDGTTMCSVGDVGLSETKNERAYQGAAAIVTTSFTGICQQAGISVASGNVFYVEHKPQTGGAAA